MEWYVLLHEILIKIIRPVWCYCFQPRSIWCVILSVSRVHRLHWLEFPKYYKISTARSFVTTMCLWLNPRLGEKATIGHLEETNKDWLLHTSTRVVQSVGMYWKFARELLWYEIEIITLNIEWIFFWHLARHSLFHKSCYQQHNAQWTQKNNFQPKLHKNNNSYVDATLLQQTIFSWSSVSLYGRYN